MSDAPELQVTDDGPVRTISLNRPEKLNALTPLMEMGLRAAMEEAGRDSAVRAIVLTGRGRGFCSGADLSPQAVAAAPPPPDYRGRGDFQQRYSYLLAIPKPIIAAINGPAFGAGFCIALFCDLRMMSADATLGSAFVRRGLIAEHGAAWILARLVGPMRALDILLSGRAISATEAVDLGLVTSHPAPTFMEEVQARAHELGTLSSPRAMGIIKHQIYASYTQSLSEAANLAFEEQMKCFASDDFREGVAAFQEKRPPAFTGR